MSARRSWCRCGNHLKREAYNPECFRGSIHRFVRPFVRLHFVWMRSGYSCCFSAAVPDSTLAVTSFQFPALSTLSSVRAPMLVSLENAQKTAVSGLLHLTTRKKSPVAGDLKTAAL